MIVIPAIDLRNGRCVRLQQGELSRETVYSDDPGAMAEQWVSQGAKRLHVVDLDGAVSGTPANRDGVRRILDAVSIPVQLGGGIRDMAALDSYLQLGVDGIILGTSAIKDPGFLKTACREFPGRIILGIDARGERVAVEGWTEETQLTPEDIARRSEKAGVSTIIYTDIRRDGMGTGPNVERTRAIARSVGIPVVASGGISGIRDVAEIASLEPEGVIGMITGRALYQGTLNLPEAILVASGAKSHTP
ncbi:MAG: 1-(5-phosphoribosyl)-5-[(5-phosphoribosylamino)methylideneamino]imidazole-4-carboxamide isomerase [Thermodesulfobacteriota bacterium]